MVFDGGRGGEILCPIGALGTWVGRRRRTAFEIREAAAKDRGRRGVCPMGTGQGKRVAYW